jgi:hypothetical protein
LKPPNIRPTELSFDSTTYDEPVAVDGVDGTPPAPVADVEYITPLENIVDVTI